MSSNNFIMLVFLILLMLFLLMSVGPLIAL
jgi:hypothetical protein